jgi:hypothetical protein
MGRIFISLIMGGIVAAGMVAGLMYFALPYDPSWVIGTAGIVALLVWAMIRKKAR